MPPHLSKLRLHKLANRLSAHAPSDGIFQFPVPAAYAFRMSRTNPKPMYANVRVAQGPALYIVAQGASKISLQGVTYRCDAARMPVLSVDLPFASQITKASESEPFLGFMLVLDPYKVAELALKVYPHGAPKSPGGRGLYVGEATDAIINAVARLVELMAEPVDAELLAPLVIDEILIRLLRSPIGGRVAQSGESQSGLQPIAKAVSWIRANFSQPMTVEELANQVNMSVSSFHQHFKAVTSMSPLQFQKGLRLHEARRLMLLEGMSAGIAGHNVGYRSASHFSREYARFFGAPPTKDIAFLREES